MQSNVNVEELNGVALEIAKSIQSLNQSISDFKELANNIKGQCEALNSYNNQKVAGTTTKELVYNDDGEYRQTIETYKLWNIEGQTPLENTCNTLEQELDGLEETISKLKLETSDLELIADTIESYIINIQDELGKDIDPSILAGSFGILEGAIAYDSYSAGTGNFISTKHIIPEYWTDKALRFERNQDGTYTIYQKDENGGDIAMGYTTSLTAALYMKELKNKVTDKSTNQEKINDIGDGSIITNSTTKYVTANQVSDEARKEIMEYADADILGEGNKEEIYNSLSSEAKDIIDGNVKVLMPTENLREIIDREMDIVIPENAKVSIEDSRIGGVAGAVFKYDQEKRLYRLDGAGKIGGAAYTKNEMRTMKITETKG